MLDNYCEHENNCEHVWRAYPLRSFYTQEIIAFIKCARCGTRKNDNQFI